VQSYFKQKEIQKLLLEIINNRRHIKTSIWLLCQNYFTIPKMVRSGITQLFVFNSVSKKELESIFEEQIEIYKDLFLKVINLCFKNPHDFLYINKESNRLFNNWDEIIIEIS
jgi:hypothetical protein